MWTKEDQAQLDELQARKEAAIVEQRKVAAEIVELLTDSEGNPNAAWGPVQVGMICDLLKPYDDGAREWPAPAEPVSVPFPYKPPRYMKATDVPDRVSGGHGVSVSRLKRMGPESGNTGYWFVDPDAYSIGPFETPEECEAYIARRYLEYTNYDNGHPVSLPPVEPTNARMTYLGHEVPEGFTINTGTMPVDSMTEVVGLWSDGQRVVNKAGNWPWAIKGKDFIVAWRLHAAPAPPAPCPQPAPVRIS